MLKIDQEKTIFLLCLHSSVLLPIKIIFCPSFLASSQGRVTGDVHLLLRPGALFVEGVESRFSLLAAARGAYGESAGEWSAADARGFSRLAALPGELHARAGEVKEAAQEELAVPQGGAA